MWAILFCMVILNMRASLNGQFNSKLPANQVPNSVGLFKKLSVFKSASTNYNLVKVVSTWQGPATGTI